MLFTIDLRKTYRSLTWQCEWTGRGGPQSPTGLFIAPVVEVKPVQVEQRKGHLNI